MGTNLRRRDFLNGLSVLAGAASAPALAFGQSAGMTGYDNTATHRSIAGRAKITEVKNVQLRVEKDLGSYTGWSGGSIAAQIGGGMFSEVHTDQGVTGIGPGVDPALLQRVNRICEGQDPCNVNLLAQRLYDQGSAATEIAIWDLIGKLANMPLYKLWGGGRDRVISYASMSRLSNPQERGEQAANLKAEGWKAFKVKAHFPTMKEDIQVVEAVRKTCGDDFILMVDANKAGLNLGSTAGISWDFTRASQTALAYERLGVYWLEEPLPRYDYDDLARLKSLTPMHLAGGEANRGLNEFNDLLAKNSFDIIQPEVMINGVNILRKAAVLAEAKYKIIEPHRGDNRLGTIACLHLVASWPNSPMHEVFNDHPLGNYDIPFAIFENPVTLDKDGYFNLPQGPGLGMKIRQDLIVKS